MPALETRIADEPLLLMAPYNNHSQIFPDGVQDAFSDARYSPAFGRYLKRVDRLVSQGIRVRILGAYEDGDDVAPHGFSRSVNDIEKLRPGLVVRLSMYWDADRMAVLWPRDVFQVYGTTVLAAPVFDSEDFHKIAVFRDKTEQILSKLGIPKKMSAIGLSDLGMGGYVVRDGNVLVVSGVAKQDSYFLQLEHEGYKVFRLPVPGEGKGTPDLESRMINNHIDTEFNLVFSPDGNALICVNQAYYAAFHEEVDGLVKELAAVLHVIPEGSQDREFLAVNFVRLPAGKVMMPGNCPYTQEFLERGLGEGNVLVSEVMLDEFSGSGGGLRCMTNLIE